MSDKHMPANTNCRLRIGLLGVAAAVLIFAFQTKPVLAYTEDECETPGVGGTCRVSCNDGENEVGTCSDNLLQVTCCSQKTIPQGGSLTPTPSGSGSASTSGTNSTGVVSSPGSPITLNNPLCPKGSPNCITINGIIGRFINLFLGMVGAIALLVFVYAGVMYMTGGSSDRIKKAVDTMKYAVLGLILIMFAYIITSFFFNALTSDVPAASKPKNVALPKS